MRFASGVGHNIGPGTRVLHNLHMKDLLGLVAHEALGELAVS